MRRRSFYFLAVLMFCFGVLLPGFVLFGWTRNARDVSDMFNYEGFGGRVNKLSQPLPLTSDTIDASDYNLESGVTGRKWKNQSQVIIFGETEKGRDSRPIISADGGGSNATEQRDFIRKVL
jgi:hypothetical protein